MSRRLRDLIPVATSQLRPQPASPSLVVQDIAGRKQRSKMQYDKRASISQREFSPGERVLVKPNPKNKHKPWIYGEVVGNPAPRACLVSTPLGPICQNHAQIRKAYTEPMRNPIKRSRPTWKLHLYLEQTTCRWNKTTVDPTNRRTGPTDGPSSRRAKQNRPTR